MSLDRFLPEPKPPYVQLVKHVDVITNDGPKRAGYWGRCPERQARVAVFRRDSQQTRIHALDAYAVSAKAIGRHRGANVKHVLFVEDDTKDVYEYPIRDFIRNPRYLPQKFLWDDEDEQVFVKRENAAHVWEDHADDVFLPFDAKTGVP